MSLTLFIHKATQASAVQLLANDFSQTGEMGTVYSGVKFDQDGLLYARQSNGGWSAFGTWLLNGTNSDYYINRTINSGTLTGDAGTGSSITLGTDRVYDIQRTSGGTSTAQVDFEIVLVSGDVVQTGISYSFLASRE